MASFEGLDKIMQDMQRKREEDRLEKIKQAGQEESQALGDFIEAVTPVSDNVFPYRSPMDAQAAEAEVSNAVPIEPTVLASSEEGKQKLTNTEIKEPAKPVEATEPKEEDPYAGMDRYQKMLAQYEESKEKASGQDLMMQGLQGLMDSLAQYSVSGGPQFAGLKPIKTKLPDLGMAKQVENKFNKQLQLEGLKRKEEELDVKRKQAKQKIKDTGLQLSKGQEARDKAFGKDYAEFANAGGYASIRKNLNTLEDVKKRLQEGDVTGGLVERFAPEGARDAYRRAFDQEGQDIKDQIEQVIQQSLRQTLGAQFTEKEAARLIERSYNTALSPEKNIERLDRTIKELDSMARAKEESGRYFEDRGTLAGYKAPLGESKPKKDLSKPPRDEIVERNGKTYKWNPSAGKYQLYNK